MGIAGVAGQLVSTPRSMVELLSTAPQRVSHAWSGVNEAITETLAVVSRAATVLDRVEATVRDVEVLVAGIGALAERAALLVDGALAIAADVAGTRELIEVQVARLQQLLDQYEPHLVALAPVAAELADTIRPRHVVAVRRALEVVPQLADLAEPALRGVAALGSELADVTERLDNVGGIVEGLPGAKMLRRRGQSAGKDESG